MKANSQKQRCLALRYQYVLELRERLDETMKVGPSRTEIEPRKKLKLVQSKSNETEFPGGR